MVIMVCRVPTVHRAFPLRSLAPHHRSAGQRALPLLTGEGPGRVCQWEQQERGGGANSQPTRWQHGVCAGSSV